MFNVFNNIKLRMLIFLCTAFIFCGCQGSGRKAIAKSNSQINNSKAVGTRQKGTEIRIFNPDFYKPGKKYAQRINMVSDLLMMFPNADHKESQLVLNYEVTKVSDNENAIVEVTIVSVKATMLSLGQRYSYDSETPNKKSNYSPKFRDRENRFRSEFVGLKGKKYQLAINLKTKTVKILKMDPRIQKIAEQSIPQGMLGPAQAVMLLGRSNLCQYASEGLFAGLKSPVVKKSQSWQEKSSVFIPKTPLVKLKKICKLTRITQKNNQKLATISFKYKRDTAKRQTNSNPGKIFPGNNRSQFKVVSIRGDGSTIVSVNKGHFISSKEKIQLGITLNLQGKPSKNKMFYIVKRNIEYIDR